MISSACQTGFLSVMLMVLAVCSPARGATIPSSVTDTFTAINNTLTPSSLSAAVNLSVTFSHLNEGNKSILGTNTVTVTGFKSDPGQSWLTSIFCSSPVLVGSTTETVGVTLQEVSPYSYETVNGTITDPNTAPIFAPKYSYSAGVGTWTWFGPPLGTSALYTENCGINYGGTSGVIFGKYKIVGLTYAPPGSKSTATYTDGFMIGSSTADSSTVSNALTVTAKLDTGVNVFGFFKGNATLTTETSWTQEQDSSTSISLQQQYSSGLQVPGPPLLTGLNGTSTDQGVDHNYDVVYIWLNPADLLIFSGNALILGGEYYDARDGQTPETCDGTTYAGITGLDVVPLTVGQLLGTQPITDGCLLERLSRPWDPALGGLNATDLEAIAKAADPFVADPSLNPNYDTTGRYVIPKKDTGFSFVPGGATHTYSSSDSITTTAMNTAKSTYSVSFEISGTASAAFFVKVGDSFSTTDKITYTTQSSSTVTSGTNQTMAYNIVAPAVGTYSGATGIQVWEDTKYGTFLFFPEN